MKTVTVAQQVAAMLADFGVSSCFQLSGGMIAFLSDEINSHPSLELVDLKHEQAAGFAAEGYARFRRAPSVAMGTSGPGATNLLTAVASCYFDSSPVVFITGQVNSAEIKGSSHQRQSGFQELDIVELASPIVKYAERISDPRDVVEVVNRALATSMDGRMGPTLVDIPIDIQQMEAWTTLPVGKSPLIESKSVGTPYEAEEAVVSLLGELSQSRAPLIVAGGGLRLSGSGEEFIRFVEGSGIPAVWSLMAKDIMATDHPLNLGMLGAYGHRWANQAVASADLLLVLGSRLDERQTGSDARMFSDGRRIFRVDIDDAELGGRVSSDVRYRLDLHDFLRAANRRVVRHGSTDLLESVDACKEKYPIVSEQKVSLEFNQDRVLSLISEEEEEAVAFVVDVGQHQMWAAQSLSLRSGQRFMTSGGHGAMGFSIPAAIGVCKATSGRVAVVIGDGSAQVCLAEFETIKHLFLDISVYVINNHQHGMVAQFQEEFLGSRFVGTVEGYSAPSFSSVAAAFGIPSAEASSEKEFLSVARKLGETSPRGPRLIEIHVDRGLRALPKLGR